ncbi:MAG: hypothetical protein ACE5I0_08540 [Candidatus Binatia bacterium]
MGFLDEVKDIVSKFRLVQIKNEVHLHGDVNMNYKGNNIHYSVPPAARKRIASSGVTPEMEAEYESKVQQAMEERKSYLESLPEKERNKLIAETSVASAVDVLTTGPRVSKAPPEDSGVGEDASIFTVRSTGPPKKPWGSDEGETA